MDSPEGLNYKQAYVILLKLEKNKEVLVSNDWRKWEKGENHFMVVGHS